MGIKIGKIDIANEIINNAINIEALSYVLVDRLGLTREQWKVYKDRATRNLQLKYGYEIRPDQ